MSLKILNAKKWDKAGEYSISVEAKDIYGNKTTGKSKLILEEDKTPPEISGAEDTEILQGKTMDFSSGVTVKDNADPDPSLSVDSTKADLNTPGTYVVTYVAKDRSGNETKVERKITVKANPEWKEKIVYLTFDDGPRRSTTTALLDGLAQRGVNATFFLIGEQLVNNEDVVQRMDAEGHQIGIHTFDHVKLTGLSKTDFDAQVDKTRQCLLRILGHNDFLLRPPYGMTDQGVKKHAGCPIILWSVDPEDWRDQNTARVVQQVVSQARDGSIILMHDIFPESVDAALQIVDQLHAQGYLFVTVDQLFAARHIPLDAGKTYSDAYP